MCTISIIIPYFNSEKTIIRAMDSIIGQTYKDFEVILVNDGSTDNSYEIVNEYIDSHKDYSFKHIYQNNSGPSKARNRGVAESNSEFVAFLDSDDSWLSKKLEIQMKTFCLYNDISILGCDYSIVKDDITIKKSKDTGNFRRISFYRRLFKNCFSTSSIIIRRNVFNELGGFNESQRYAEDTLLFLRVLRKYNGGKIEKSLVNLYKNEYGDAGLSADLWKTERCELENFNILRKENESNNKKISLLLYIIVYLFSILKYFRRILLIKIRKR